VALDPQVASWLQRVAALELPSYDQVTPAVARRMIEAGTFELARPAESVANVEDLIAGGVPARLYEPDHAEGGILVWFHGGGWVIGSHARYADDSRLSEDDRGARSVRRGGRPCRRRRARSACP
jgi:acetyl esterase/lipase